MTAILHAVYRRLHDTFGPQQWWPADGVFEIIVGAVLTQNTAWRNVERALDNLREMDALNVTAIHQMRVEELAELIRPAGYYRLKSKRLKNLITLIVEQFNGSLQELFALGKTDLRSTLIQVNGIGPETADSIILYAAELPVFVVDAYTARVMKRHGWIEQEADYHAIQDEFHRQLEEAVPLFNEYHALLVQVGKQYCRTKPQCDECPLYDMLPNGKPVEPFG